MSDYSSVAPISKNSQSFEAAVQRAKLVAAKIEGGGGKRPLEDGSEPSPKKLAGLDTGGNNFQQPAMSAAAAAALAAAQASARLGVPSSGMPQHMMPLEQAQNEYIRVPDKMVGLIIGRGGEQITRLQAESGCKIQMAPDSGGQPERMCTLTGTREAINKAKEMVNQIVHQRGRENQPPPEHQRGMGGMGGMGGSMGGGMGDRDRSMGGGSGGGGGLGFTEEMMIPGPKVGLIIGKNGKTIKQLQEQTGAKMVIIQDGPNTEYEKPLRITGDPEKVEYAKQLVYELINEKDNMPFGGGGGGGGGGRHDDYQDQGNGMPNSQEVLVPKEAVGVVIGKGGDMIKRIQAETGCRVQFHQERDKGPGDKRCYLQGKPHQVDQARMMIQDLIDSVNRKEQDMRGGGRGGRGGGGGQRNGDRGDFNNQWQENKMEVQFTVNNVKCGLIIGRGGEVIKQINAQSGAHCELDRRIQNNDKNLRTFFIRGHPEAVEQCKRIITEKVGMPINFMTVGGDGICGGGGPGGGGDMFGGGSGPAAWGYNPHWHQQNNQQPQQVQQQVQINPVTGQPDYSQQWIDYYRSLGLNREAEAIEQQVKQQQPGGGAGNGPSAAVGGAGGGGNPPGAAPGHAGGAAGGGAAGPAQPDYSAQWAEYYRSIGKLKEAEAIELQMKVKQAPQQPIAAPSPVQGAGGAGGGSAQGGGMGGPGMPGQFPGPNPYGAPMPYPGAPMPYPGYAQYPGAPQQPLYPGAPGNGTQPSQPDHQQ